CHVKVGSARHAVSELQLEIGKGLDQGWIGFASDVAVKDVLDLRQSERPARIGFVEVYLLAPALYLGGILPGVREGVQDETLHAFRLRHGVGARADRPPSPASRSPPSGAPRTLRGGSRTRARRSRRCWPGPSS